MRLVIEEPSEHCWGTVSKEGNRKKADKVELLKEFNAIPPFHGGFHSNLDLFVFSFESLKFTTYFLNFFLTTTTIRVHDH